MTIFFHLTLILLLYYLVKCRSRSWHVRRAWYVWLGAAVVSLLAVWFRYDGVQRFSQRRCPAVGCHNHRSRAERRRVTVQDRRWGPGHRGFYHQDWIVIIATARPPSSSAQGPRRSRTQPASHREQRARATTHAFAERRIPGPARGHPPRPARTTSVQDRDADAGQELHQSADERRLRDARRARPVRGPTPDPGRHGQPRGLRHRPEVHRRWRHTGGGVSQRGCVRRGGGQSIAGESSGHVSRSSAGGYTASDCLGLLHAHTLTHAPWARFTQRPRTGAASYETHLAIYLQIRPINFPSTLFFLKIYLLTYSSE